MISVGNERTVWARIRTAGASAPASPPSFGRALVFGLQIADTTIADAAAWIVERALSYEPTDIAFLNAHCVNVMCRDRAYRDALASMTCLFADGIGMRLAARTGGVELADNVNGTDLFPVICREAAAAGAGLYLLGAREGIAAGAAIAMKRANPGLIVSGTHHGYIGSPDEEARVVAEINASGATILLVALGVPQQELWIARNRHRVTVPVVIGVGGLFDYYSGRIPRAPLALRKAGLEWAWRLAMEPRRLARRYIVGNAEFLARLAMQRLVAPNGFRTLPAASSR